MAILKRKHLSVCGILCIQLICQDGESICRAATALDYDLAPYLIDGKLVMGGRTHTGLSLAPAITVFGYSPSENTTDQYNPVSPGFYQLAGTGNLPGGATLYCRVTSSLLYWDGTGEANFGSPDESARIDLWLRASYVSIDSDSGVQSPLLIQSVSPYGSVHLHGVSALYADSVHTNNPEDSTFLAAANGIYAYSIEVTMYSGDSVYQSDPLWIVLNYGMPDDALVSAVYYFDSLSVPEPATLAFMGGLCAALFSRRH